MIPALFTSTSISPLHASAKVRIDARSVSSRWRTSVCPAIPCATAVPFATLRTARMTRAPARANCRVVATPRPLEAPVTITVFPAMFREVGGGPVLCGHASNSAHMSISCSGLHRTATSARVHGASPRRPTLSVPRAAPPRDAPGPTESTTSRTVTANDVTAGSSTGYSLWARCPMSCCRSFGRHGMFEPSTQADEMKGHGLPVSPIGVRGVLRSVCVDEPLRDLGISGGARRVLPFEDRAVQRPAPGRCVHICVDGSFRDRHCGPTTEADDVRHGNTVPPTSRENNGCVRLRTDINERALPDLASRRHGGVCRHPLRAGRQSVFENDGAARVLHDLTGMAAAGASPPPAPGGHASIVESLTSDNSATRSPHVRRQ